MDTQDPVVAWHFARPDRRLGYDDGREIKRGSVFELPAGFEPVICARGFHGSINPVDALDYAPGLVVSRTEHRGVVVYGTDKLASSVREHIVVVNATNTVAAFADWCIERAKSLATRHGDPVAAARYAATVARYVDVVDVVDVARYAGAADVARYAGAADVARYAAARYAATATRYASDVAAAAARDAERKLQNEKLTEMLCELIQREGFR